MIPAGLTAGVGALGAAVAALINWSSLNDKIVNNVFKDVHIDLKVGVIKLKLSKVT